MHARSGVPRWGARAKWCIKASTCRGPARGWALEVPRLGSNQDSSDPERRRAAGHHQCHGTYAGRGKANSYHSQRHELHDPLMADIDDEEFSLDPTSQEARVHPISRDAFSRKERSL